jgi:hypothetical protein
MAHPAHFLQYPAVPLLGMAQESELAKRISELADRVAFASKGQVLSVRGNQAYLDMGEQAGVIEGTRLEVVRLGDPLVVGGKVIGHEETIDTFNICYEA